MAKTETAPIYVIRYGDKLVGEMQADRDAIEAFQQGTRLRVDIRTGRVPSRLRFYFQLLRKLIAATDCALNTDALHEVVKLETGHTTPVRLGNGMKVLVPASIAFDKMSEEDFGVFLEKAIQWIAETYGVTPEQLMNREQAA